MSYSDDELPELNVLLGIPTLSAGSSTANTLRRSPRKRTGAVANTSRYEEDRVVVTATSNQTQRSPSKRSPTKATQVLKQTEGSKLSSIPNLSRKTEAPAPSKSRASPHSRRKPLHLPHVDSLLLPLSKLAMQDSSLSQAVRPAKASARSQSRQIASRFVLNESRCNDDEEDSVPEGEDQDTDLSGFVVDDQADLSFHEWSDAESMAVVNKKKDAGKTQPRRRLQRGPRRRPSLASVPDHSDGELVSKLGVLGLENGRGISKQASIEVIDLTESPEKALLQRKESRGLIQNPVLKPSLLDRFSDALKFSPPRIDAMPDLPSKQPQSHTGTDMEAENDEKVVDKFTTPPATPPRSPSKLNSPSKLLSPSKRDFIPRSPHRQSTDAFWDLHAINDWNDEYSPKKAPLASPGKRHLARFQIWSDDSADDDLDDTTSSLPSPCLSPTKPRSPMKSPEKAERQRISAEKKAAKARKVAFDATKEQLASDLLSELDKSITSSKLSTLAASTGGVQIVWSKTLRSTAGRANWRRTVTKPTSSPIKSNTIPSGPGVKVEHHANIELASKVIDSEDRLVNTLAHEFCHLANFMVSNVRDQPHGASFKAWAKKVTAHLQKSDNELWRKVEVTTKHSYKIDHKYLWLCVGRERRRAMEFLSLEDDEGCGAEYGRHSKSIDTEKQRCGRCKGRLVQVRPKPRGESPVKKTVAKKAGEVFELSD